MSTYGEQHIQTMQALQHIRAFTARYVGEFDTDKGHTHFIKELIDNCVDEAVVNPGKHHTINVAVLQGRNKFQVVVQDNGRGIPLGSLTAAFSEPRTSGKWSDAYVATAGCHGEGAKAVAAIARRFIGMSRRDNGVGLVEIGDGEILRSKTWSVKSKDQDSGTLVFFETDPKFLTTAGQYSTNEGGLRLLCQLLEFLGVFVSNTTFNLWTDSVLLRLDELSELSSNALWTKITSVMVGEPVFKTTPTDRRAYVMRKLGVDTVTWELQLTRKFKPSDSDESRIGVDLDLFATIPPQAGMFGAVNLIPIHDSNSFHISGVTQIIKEKLAGCITNKDVRMYFISHYKLPICGSVVVRVVDPKFVGQTKDQYKDRGFVEPYRKVLKPLFDHVSQMTWETLYELIENNLDEEYLAFLNRGKSASAGLKGLNLRINKASRYSDCDTRDSNRAELFITEGLSAGGTVSQVRDPQYQAVFKMTGKSINAIRSDMSDVRNNPILQDLITVLGIQIGARDLSGLNFGKIIILTDADSDGKHIAALIIGFLYRLSPLLFESRRVFISNPPLYAMSLNRVRGYFKDRIALMDSRIFSVYRRVMQITLVNIVTNQRKTLVGEDFRSYVYNVCHIGQVIENISGSVTVDPVYLEALCSVADYLTAKTMNTKIIKDALGLDAVTYHKDTDTLVLTAQHIDVVVPLVNLSEILKSELIPELQSAAYPTIIPEVTFLYNSDTEPVMYTNYQLYRCFKKLDDLMPVHRYKGLGEMAPSELSAACVDPATRSYYVITEMGDVDRLFAALDTDPKHRKELLS